MKKKLRTFIGPPAPFRPITRRNFENMVSKYFDIMIEEYKKLKDIKNYE